MKIYIVVDDLKRWNLHIPGVEVVSASDYLTNGVYSNERGARVFNLCRSYRYQKNGYYVSLLAAARGHKPLPTVSTIQDMKSQAVVRIVSDELDELIQNSLKSIHSATFDLSVYFGRNMAKRHERLSQQLFKLFPVPLLRAHFAYKDDEWQLLSIGPIPASEIPDTHLGFVVEVAASHFAQRGDSKPRRKQYRYDLAILVNEEDKTPPSDEAALDRFVRAAETLGMRTEIIGKEDYGRLSEFDALFIRETTSVTHHTFRFASRAQAEGLVVIDDPDSILKCTNKVYLAEMLERYDLPAPKTMIVHRENLHQVEAALGLPCVLKQPDSSFSLGVMKVETREELMLQAERLLETSELIVAQAFLRTEFDWRIGVLDNVPLYACRYYMARKHWQITKLDAEGKRQYGKTETLPVESAPKTVVDAAVAAARRVGTGLYGVDLKWDGDKVYLIEINDNPTIEAGVEDKALKGELYSRIMRVFLGRLDRKREARPW